MKPTSQWCILISMVPGPPSPCPMEGRSRANVRRRAWRWFHPTSKNQASRNDALREPINFRNSIRISSWIIQMIVTLVMSSLAKHLCWRSLVGMRRSDRMASSWLHLGDRQRGAAFVTTTNRAKWACRKIYFNLEKSFLCIWMLLLSLQIVLYMCVIIFSYIFGYTLIMGNDDDDDPPLDFGVPHFWTKLTGVTHFWLYP